MTRQDQKETGGMRTPHRRDVSARQDLLGRELRQLFADYTLEDMPEELQKLALQLQSAMAERPPAPPRDLPASQDATGDAAPADGAEGEPPPARPAAAGKSSVPG